MSDDHASGSDHEMPRTPPLASIMIAAVGALFLAACGEPPAYDLRRASFSGEPGELFEAGGVSRPGQRVRDGVAKTTLDLTDLSGGRVTLFVAPSEVASYGGGVDVELREAGVWSYLGVGFHDVCSLRWGEPGNPAGVPWQRCTFDLTAPVRSARLEITRRGSAEGDVYLSEVRIEGGADRQRPDVFVLLLDALRFDGMRPFREDSHVGVHMTELARDSVVLQNLRSSSSWTRPAVATLFTGLRVDRHRIRDRGDVLTDEAVTLAELLKEQGYSTAAWSTNPNVLPVWGLAQGFDAFIDQGSQSWGAHKTDGARVISRMRAALADRGNEPLFYYAHLMDPHAPYLPNAEQKKAATAIPELHFQFPRPYRIFSAPADWQAFLDYTGELLDTDDHVGAFVRLLKEAGLYEQSLVLVVVDHGEEFLDHNGRDHGRTLYEEMLHVPAMIKFPGNRHAGLVVSELLSFVDLMPTLLDTLGMALPPALDGVAIDTSGPKAAPARPHVALLGLDGRRQSAILDPPWKLIRNDVLRTTELYNLERDPRERANVAAAHPDEAKRLTSAMDLIMSHGQEGWHLLLCGTLAESRMDVTVRPSSGTLETFGLEENEVTTTDEAGKPRSWRLRPVLSPIPVERPVFGKLAKVHDPEHVELRLASEETTVTIEITSESGTKFDYRTGTKDISRSTARLLLDPRSSSVTVASGARVECINAAAPGAKSTPPTSPFLRAWYVPPAEKVAVETLDPAMQERLRALGYLQ